MKNLPLTLFLEINNSSFIFSVGKNDEFNNFKVIESLAVPLDGIENKKIYDLEKVLKVLKKNVYNLEKKLNFSFNEIILILENFKFEFINLSGFKKLNGSQILRENITYIINALKSYVDKIETQKTIIHIFNSRFCLDNTKVENLPIGLFGNFYTHELSFTLIDINDYKNIKNVFEKCNLKIKRIFHKGFVKGAFISNKNKDCDTFLHINIGDENSKVFYFENNSLKFEQSFEFGSNIIVRDISKITSLNIDIIKKILIKEKFNEKMKDSELVEKEYFIENNYRKIKKNLIYQISLSRIQEISEIFFKKNINLCHYNKKTKNIFLECNDKVQLQSFEEIYKSVFFSGSNIVYENLNDFPNESVLGTANNLVHFGWKKEAIPVSRPQKSIIGKLFDAIFS